MKAIEYYEKYKDRMFGEEPLETVVKDLLFEFNDETIEIGNSRHVGDGAVLAVLKEQNQKWNAIDNLFEKKHHSSPLMHNGYIKWWEEALPAVKDAMTKGR